MPKIEVFHIIVKFNYFNFVFSIMTIYLPNDILVIKTNKNNNTRLKKRKHKDPFSKVNAYIMNHMFKYLLSKLLGNNLQLFQLNY